MMKYRRQPAKPPASATPPPEMVGVVEREGIETMRSRGGTWAAYQNEVLDHSALGTWRFLRVGEGCTFTTPPSRYPDTARYGVGWAWIYKGMLDLENGEVKP